MKECPVCKTLNEDQNQKCPSCNYQFAAEPDNSSVFLTDESQAESNQLEPQAAHKRHGKKALYVVIPVVIIFILVLMISIADYIQSAKDAQAVIIVHNSKIETLIADRDMTDSSAA